MTSLAAISLPAGNVQSSVPSFSPHRTAHFVPRERWEPPSLCCCEGTTPRRGVWGVQGRGWRVPGCRWRLFGGARGHTAFPSPLGCQLSCRAAGQVPALRAAPFHQNLRLGFGGRRFRHPLGEHDLREGESPAPRRGQRRLGREFREIKSRGSDGTTRGAAGGTVCPHTLGSPTLVAPGIAVWSGRCVALSSLLPSPDVPLIPTGTVTFSTLCKATWVCETAARTRSLKQKRVGVAAPFEWKTDRTVQLGLLPCWCKLGGHWGQSRAQCSAGHWCSQQRRMQGPAVANTLPWDSRSVKP